jgi:hypothetical protein
MATHRNCEGMTRRDSLRLGLGAFVAGGLASALSLRRQARAAAPAARPTSCILFWLDGGPTHYETFDPKPDAPKEIRGEHEPIPTRTPGVRFAKNLRRLARIQDKIAVVRSIRHDQGNHGAGNHYLMTGAPPRIPVGCGAFVSFHPSFGSVVAREREESQRAAGKALPLYFSLPSMTRSGGPSFLGARYAPFVVPDNPNSTSFRVRDIALPAGLNGDRFLSRLEFRKRLDSFVRFHDAAVADPIPALDAGYEEAVRLVTSPQAQSAFDLSRESDRVRDAYGRTTVGQRALLARRLVEVGVPFVTLNEGGWDHHTNLFQSLDKQLPPLDQAVAALVEDLGQRGLLDTTLILVLGEFGRTPQINKDAGRDHWSNAMSVLIAGCGTPGGLVVGSTDPQGYSAHDRVLAPENLAATVYAKLGIDPGKIYLTGDGRPVHLVSDPTPITELMG